jgi:hypothetical protein
MISRARVASSQAPPRRGSGRNRAPGICTARTAFRRRRHGDRRPSQLSPGNCGAGAQNPAYRPARPARTGNMCQVPPTRSGNRTRHPRSGAQSALAVNLWAGGPGSPRGGPPRRPPPDQLPRALCGRPRTGAGGCLHHGSDGTLKQRTKLVDGTRRSTGRLRRRGIMPARRKIAVAAMPHASGVGDTGHTRRGSHLCRAASSLLYTNPDSPVWKGTS